MKGSLYARGSTAQQAAKNAHTRAAQHKRAGASRPYKQCTPRQPVRPVLRSTPKVAVESTCLAISAADAVSLARSQAAPEASNEVVNASGALHDRAHSSAGGLEQVALCWRSKRLGGRRKLLLRPQTVAAPKRRLLEGRFCAGSGQSRCVRQVSPRWWGSRGVRVFECVCRPA